MRFELPEIALTSGISLTFDDDYIAQWHANRELFQEFELRATFFVRGLSRLSDAELRTLMDLRADGHEIGSHGFRHKSVVRHYGGDAANVGRYIEEEILPAIESMRAFGLEAHSFAYPYGHHTPEYDAALLQHFQHIRCVAYTRSYVAPHRLRAIFHDLGSGQRVHHAIGLDNAYGNVNQMSAALSKAARMRLVVGLYAHNLAENDGHYSLRPSKLRTLLQQVRRLGMRSFTLRELQ